MATKLTNQLARIPEGCAIVHSNIFEDYDEIVVSRPIPKEHSCPTCGSTHCVIKAAPEYQCTRHIAISRRPIILTYQKQPFACAECGSSFFDHPDWVLPGLKISKPLALQLFRDLMGMKSLHEIALNTGISYSVMETFFTHLDLPAPEFLPDTVCIDEFKGETGSWNPEQKRFITNKFHTAIADGTAGRIIDILPTRKAGDAVQYFLTHFSPKQRKKVKYFCCDMSNSYISVARRCFPDAVICIDLFHVIQRLNGAMDAVRRQLQNEARENGDKENYLLLFHLTLALKTAKRNVPLKWGSTAGSKEKQLQKAFDTYPKLHSVYQMLQDFHSLMDQQDVFSRSILLGKWISEYINSDIPDIAAAARTVRRWKGMIINSWTHGRSNGPAEGLNDKIKVIKRISFGMHRFDSFRKRILLVCGPLVPAEEYVHIHLDQLKKQICREGRYRLRSQAGSNC